METKYYIVTKNGQHAWSGRHWKPLLNPSGLKTKYYKTRHGAQRMVNILEKYGECSIRESVATKC